MANLKKKEAEHHQAVQSYMERIRKLEQDKKLMETKLLGFDGTQKKPNQTSSEEFEALKQSYFVKERKWKDDAEKAESKVNT